MKIRKGFVLREVAGNTIVISVGAARDIFQGMIQLNETGKEIWRGIEEGLTVERIAQRLEEIYEVDLEEARQDTEEVIGQLKKAGILEECEQKQEIIDRIRQRWYDLEKVGKGRKIVVKKEYKKPVVQFIELQKEDVLTGSNQNTLGESDPTSSDELLNDIVMDDFSPVKQNTPRFYHRGVNGQINIIYNLIKSIPFAKSRMW